MSLYEPIVARRSPARAGADATAVDITPADRLPSLARAQDTARIRGGRAHSLGSNAATQASEVMRLRASDPLRTTTLFRGGSAVDAQGATAVAGDTFRSNRAMPRGENPAGRSALQRLHSTHPSGGAVVSKPLQAKLTVSQPSDVLEQEADRVADEVMRMPEPVVGLEVEAAPLVQRSCSECQGGVKRQSVAEAGGQWLQAQSESDGAMTVSPAAESAIQTLPAHGQPLPESVRSFMEPRFGADFSGVRVHTDDHSQDLAQFVSAQAFTVGRDVVFGAGHYAPTTGGGTRLIAHELAHVVQQTGVAGKGSMTAQRAAAVFTPAHGILQRTPSPAFDEGDLALIKKPTELVKEPDGKSNVNVLGKSNRLAPDTLVKVTGTVSANGWFPILVREKEFVGKLGWVLPGYLKPAPPPITIQVPQPAQPAVKEQDVSVGGEPSSRIQSGPEETGQGGAGGATGQPVPRYAGAEGAPGDVDVVPPYELTEEEKGGLGFCIQQALQGEFQEDPELCSILIDTAVSLIPFVDQVADARDLTAHLYFIALKNDFSPLRWVGLAFTLLGLVPEVGSVVKGLSKTAKKGATGASEIFRKADGITNLIPRQLTEDLRDLILKLSRSIDQNWDELVALGMHKWDSLLETVIERLRRIPATLETILTRVMDVRRESSKYLEVAFKDVKPRVEEAISNALDFLGEKAFPSGGKSFNPELAPAGAHALPSSPGYEIEGVYHIAGAGAGAGAGRKMIKVSQRAVRFLRNVKKQVALVHEVLPAGKARDRRVTAILVAQDKQGVLHRIVAGGTKTLNEAQKAEATKWGLIPIPNPSTVAEHAEIAAYDALAIYVKHLNLQPVAIVASKRICPQCLGELVPEGFSLIEDTVLVIKEFIPK